jgi:hypothetical protein
MAVQGLAMGDVVPDEDLPTNEVPDSDLPDTNQPDDTSIPEFSAKTKNVLGGATELAGSAIANIPHAAAHGGVDLYRRITGGDTAAPDPKAVQAIQVPVGQRGQDLAQSIRDVRLPGDPQEGSDVNEAANFGVHGPLKFAKDYVAPVVGDVAALTPAVGAAAKVLPAAWNATKAVGSATKNAFLGRTAATDALPTPLSAQDVVNMSAAGQSMGAAAAGVDVSKLTPETQAEIVEAGKQGMPINQTAVQNHHIAETLPVPEGEAPLRLRKGQALQDEQQKSDEKNMRADPDTQGILAKSIADQDQTLVGSMGEIRRRATPDIVQRENPEHDQAAIDSIKSQDNSTVTDARAKYKALADANGGDMPIDSGTTINNINARLKKGSLRNTARDNGVISEVMDNLTSGDPMDFETFDGARSRLAEVQRRGGSEGVAAGIVHDELNNMPLSAEASPLRDLADTARSAWAARANTIKLNPAYAAAIDDNVPKVNGLHDVGKDSPLAGNFLDRFAIGNGPNASRAYVQRLKEAVPDPVLHSSIEAATLNKLRDAAGIDANGKGTFANASYRNARNAISPKADVLMSPDSVANTEQLKQASGLVNDEGKSSTTNRSNTALTLQRFGAPISKEPGVAGQLANVGADIAAGHMGPAAIVTKKIAEGAMKKSSEAKAIQATKDAKLKFAIDATKPGAGIAGDAPTSRIQRASGGKVVSHEELVERLMRKWKAAKKATDATTKPLLGVSDNSIARALEISGNAL